MSKRSVSHIRSAVLAVALSNALWADQSGAATLAPATFLNLETGAVSRSGGDIFFDGSTLAPQGGAGLFSLGKVGSRIFKSIQARHASSVSYSAAPIPAGALVSGEVFGVHTNGGHYAKVIVSATNNGTVSLQYTVFGATAPVADATSAPPVITVNGMTVTPALYYTSAAQIAAVLPSNTPVGNGTITVTYAGQMSSATPIKVVANAPGLDTLYGTGNGSAVVTDNSGKSFASPNKKIYQR